MDAGLIESTRSKPEERGTRRKLPVAKYLADAAAYLWWDLGLLLFPVHRDAPGAFPLSSGERQGWHGSGSGPEGL
jgi:hypothetical protein